MSQTQIKEEDFHEMDQSTNTVHFREEIVTSIDDSNPNKLNLSGNIYNPNMLSPAQRKMFMENMQRSEEN